MEIRQSIAKTNRVLIIDEDMPGGASAYILQQLLDEQDVYPLLDSQPKLLTAQEHRTAYAEDGDYFSKPSSDDIFECVYEILNENGESLKVQTFREKAEAFVSLFPLSFSAF